MRTTLQLLSRSTLPGLALALLAAVPAASQAADKKPTADGSQADEQVGSEDAREALAAAVAKRDPVFKGT